MLQVAMARPDFVFVFATVGHEQQALLRSVREVTGGAPLSGCSGEGVITWGMVDESNFTVAVMAIKSDEMRFGNVSVNGDGRSARQVGRALAEETYRVLAPDSFACFVFADGLAFDFEPLLRAFEGGLPKDQRLPVFGGLSADNWISRKTYQYHNDEASSGTVSCVILSGTAQVAWGVNHGCTPVGTKRIITRCKGNVIYEIDGIPALEAIREYVEGDLNHHWNKLSLNLCLGFRLPQHLQTGYNEYVIRYMMAKDDRAGSVTIQSDVENGTELWITRRDKELMHEGLKSTTERITGQMGGRPPKFVLQFECVGRGRVLFREQEKLELLTQLQTRLGTALPWIGFYSYGEIAPISGCNYLHNFSAVVVSVY
ncbi:FIST signal transduction protein [Geomesophilobacter sediminis]|nr:FIST N-terminal domain-containing protein [Geomesophilobacter sediminis]